MTSHDVIKRNFGVLTKAKLIIHTSFISILSCSTRKYLSGEGSNMFLRPFFRKLWSENPSKIVILLHIGQKWAFWGWYSYLFNYRWELLQTLHQYYTHWVKSNSEKKIFHYLARINVFSIDAKFEVISICSYMNIPPQNAHFCPIWSKMTNFEGFWTKTSLKIVVGTCLPPPQKGIHEYYTIK